MEIFKLSHRQRYLKIWLIAIACQTGQLFAQIESSLYEDYPTSGASEANWNASQFAQDARFDDNSSYNPQDYSSSTNNYWQVPEGINQDQIQELLYPPDNSPQYSYPLQPQSYYIPSNVAAEGPQNGQWPSTSNSERQDIPEQNPQYDSETTQNGWQNQNISSSNNPTDFPPSDSVFEPYTFDSISQPNESVNDNSLPETAWSSSIDQSPPQQLSDWEEPAIQNLDYSKDTAAPSGSWFEEKRDLTTSHRSEDFAPFPPPKQMKADEQNFTTFDPALTEGPDKIQHPLSKDGEATSYHFGSEASTLSTPQIHPKIHEQASHANLNKDVLKEEKSENSKKEDSDQREEIPQSLSNGKSNIKLVKKRPDPIPPARRLEEALNQPEEIIGKQIVTDPVVGLVDDAEQQSLSYDTFLHAKTPQKEKTASLNTLSSHTAINDVIAQTTSANNSEPPSEPENILLNNPPINQIPSVTNPAIQTAQRSAAALPDPTKPRPPTVITPSTPGTDFPEVEAQTGHNKPLKEISINFNNVAMIEYIRFMSRISNKNFIFDDEDLQFNVTIVSEEPTTIDNFMAALLQELKIRDLSLIEQGNNIIIHRNPRVRAPARIVADGTELISAKESELVTRVFRLNTLDPIKASEIIRPLLSDDALIEVLRDTNNLIITDLVTNRE